MKRKLIIFLFTICLIFPSFILLSACDNDTNTQNQTKTISNVEVVYKDDTYDFDSTNTVTIPYYSGINFSAEDFSIKINYIEDSPSTIISSNSEGVEFGIYKYAYNEQTHEYEEVVADSFTPDNYYIKGTYQNFNFYVSFIISAYDIEEENALTVEYQENHTYQHEENNSSSPINIEPEVTVSYKGNPLVLNTDYTIEYSNNYSLTTEDDKAHITITGIGEYSGTKVYDFNILPIELSAPIITAKTYTYDGEDHAYETAQINIPYGFGYSINYVTLNGTESVYNVVNVGTYTFEIHINRDNLSYGYKYDGNDKISTTITINRASIENYSYNNQIQLTYDNRTFGANDFYFLVNLKKNQNDTSTFENTEHDSTNDTYKTTYEIQMNSGEGIDNRNVSLVDALTGNFTRVGKFTIVGMNNYIGEIEVEYTILKKDISSASISSINSVEYNGTSQKPEPANVELYMNSDNNLFDSWVTITKTTDYTLTYPTDTTTAGEKTIIITGIGNFTGTTSVNYNITRKPIDIGSYVQEANWEETTTLIYNGLDQKSSIELSITGVDINYTIKTYEDPEIIPEGSYSRNEVTLTELKNGKKDYYDGYFVTFSFSISNTNDTYGNKYADNYELSNVPSSNSYKTVYIRPLEISSATFKNEYTFDGTHTVYSQEIPYKTYTGSAHKPPIVVNATINSEPYTLIEGTDYTTKYKLANYYSYDDVENPTDANEYVVYPDFSIGKGYQNFCYSPHQNGSAYYYDARKELRYDITKAVLTSTQQAEIIWPTVTKKLWSRYAYFDLDSSSTTLQNQNVAIQTGSLNLVGNFALVLTDPYSENHYRSYVDSNNQIDATFSCQNYEDVTKTLTATIYSPLTSFYFNGTQLTNIQIDTISSTVWGDKFEIVVPNGYVVKYYAHGNYYGANYEVTKTEDQTLTAIVGNETYEDTDDGTQLVMPYSVYISVYTADDLSSPVVSRYFDVVNGKGIFTEYKTYAGVNENLDVLIQHKFDWGISVGNALKVEMAQTGYKVSYSVQYFDNDSGVDSLPETAKTTSIAYTTTPKDKIVTVYVYNSTNDLIFSVKHNVNNYLDIFTQATIQDTSTYFNTAYLYGSSFAGWQDVINTGNVEVGNEMTININNDNDYYLTIGSLDPDNTETNIATKTKSVNRTIQANDKFHIVLLYKTNGYYYQVAEITLDMFPQNTTNQ